MTDSGFLGTTPTLSCSQIGDDALVQVYPDGIRHIRLVCIFVSLVAAPQDDNCIKLKVKLRGSVNFFSRIYLNPVNRNRFS